MKKKLMFALAAACCAVALPACDKAEENPAPAAESPAPEAPAAPVDSAAAPAAEAPAAPVAEAPAPAAEAPATIDHVTCLKGMIACMDGINASLDTVKDKESADAAAAELAPIFERMQMLMLQGEQLDEPTGDALAAVMVLKPEFEKKFGEMIAKLGTIVPHYHGSEALKTLLESM